MSGPDSFVNWVTVRTFAVPQAPSMASSSACPDFAQRLLTIGLVTLLLLLPGMTGSGIADTLVSANHLQVRTPDDSNSGGQGGSDRQVGPGLKFLAPLPL